MPVWAAVLLPIATGLIGVLGGVTVARLGIKHSREQERRRVLGEAAGTFAEKIGGAAHAVRFALDAGSAEVKPFDDAKQLVGETANILARVELQFEVGTSRFAREVQDALETAITSLQGARYDEARAALELSEKRRAAFNRRVRHVIWPT
jgi:hypothetical protein